jgi:hypothetical protein
METRESREQRERGRIDDRAIEQGETKKAKALKETLCSPFEC